MMPYNFRAVVGGGALITFVIGAFYGARAGIAISITFLAVGIVWLLMHAFHNYPRSYRGHFITALMWTVVLGVQTEILLRQPRTNSVTAYLTLIVAGLVWIPAWKQWRERWYDSLKPRPLFARLLVQTLWGPLALFIAVIGLNLAGQRLFEIAISRNDVSTALLLRNCNWGDVNTADLQNGFRNAITRGDTDAVSAYLTVGTPTYLYSVEAEDESGENRSTIYLAMRQKKDAILEMILDHGVSPNRDRTRDGESMLHFAVEQGDSARVRILLRHGANLKIKDDYGKTPLERAKEQGNKEIIALLAQSAK